MIPTWQENKMNDSAFDTGERSAFDSWYNGMVGFHINSERILEDLDSTIYCDGVDPVRVRKWMAVCWNSAIDAVEAKTWDFYWKNEKAGEDLDYALEALKEKI
jgi:hypothetical protein